MRFALFNPLATCYLWLGQPIQKLLAVSHMFVKIEYGKSRHTLSTHGALPSSRILFDPLHDTVLLKRLVSLILVHTNDIGTTKQTIWKL